MRASRHSSQRGGLEVSTGGFVADCYSAIEPSHIYPWRAWCQRLPQPHFFDIRLNPATATTRAMAMPIHQHGDNAWGACSPPCNIISVLFSRSLRRPSVLSFPPKPHLCRSVAVQAAVLVTKFYAELTPTKPAVQAFGCLVRPAVPPPARCLVGRPRSLVDHISSRLSSCPVVYARLLVGQVLWSSGDLCRGVQGASCEKRMNSAERSILVPQKIQETRLVMKI